MDDSKTKEIVDTIFISVFDYKNPFTLDEVLTKFAFDVQLPQAVKDSTTGEITWASSINASGFISQINMENREDWMLPKQPINSLEEILEIWKKTNYLTTERQYYSTNVVKSDTIYGSENVYRSTNSKSCKNLIFSDGCYQCEFIVASQRSNSCSFCIRVDDSYDCINSYNVVCSNKISNSYFIQDCSNLHECLFCSHITNKRYCIANMEFERDEYFAIKEAVIKWILNC
jgi:hypothetical protein